jgi:hypothetical protein
VATARTLASARDAMGIAVAAEEFKPCPMIVRVAAVRPE